MANRTIASLPPVSGLSGAEVVPVDQADVLGNIGTFSANINQIVAFIQGAYINPQLANTVAAGPISGGVAVPTFRRLIGADLPDPGLSTKGGVTAKAAIAGQFLTSIDTSGNPVSSTLPPLTGADLPNPTPTTKGGVKSYTAPANEYLTQIDTNGQPISAVLNNPGVAVKGGVKSYTAPANQYLTGIDLTGQPVSAAIPTGALPTLPDPTPTTKGGVKSLTAIAGQFLTSIGTDGTPTQAAITTGNLPTLPDPTPTTKGGVKSYARPANQFLTAIGTDGTPASALIVGADLPDPSSSTKGGVKAKAAIGGQFLTAILPDGTPVSAVATSGPPPAPTPVTLGGVFSYTAPANQFLTAVDTTGQFVSAQPSAANLSNGVTGSGLMVLQTSPTLITPNLGTATANSINKLTISSPATGATLNIADGKTLTTSQSVIIAGAPLTVVGRSVNLAGNVGEIAATAASDAVLREQGNSIGFGTIATGGIANNAIDNTKLRTGGALTVIGRSANSTGNVADIAAGAGGGGVLLESGSTLGFAQIVDANVAAGAAIQQSKIAGLSTTFVAKAGDTMTGNLTVAPAAGTAAVVLSASAGQQSSVILSSAGTNKWTVGRTAIDDFYVYDNVSATFIITAASNGTTVNFNRSVVLNADPAVPFGAATKQYADTKVAKTGDTMTGPLAITGSVAGVQGLTILTPSTAASGVAPILDLKNDRNAAINESPGVIRFWGKDSAGGSPAGPIVQFIAIENAVAPGAASGQIYVSTQLAGVSNNRVVVGAGVWTPNATGGDMGVDTINAKAVYENGVRAVPAGVIFPWAGLLGNIPAGYFACNGQNIGRVNNPTLFAALGTFWGAGDGSTTFGIPDLRGRVPAGVDDMGGGAAGRLHSGAWAGAMNAVTLGGIGGEELHTMTGVESAPHTHNHNHAPNAGGAFYASGAGGGGIPAGSNYTTKSTTDTDATGASGYSGGSHNTLQPTLLVNYIIRGG